MQAEFERAREPPTELPPRLLATNERRKRERGLEELGIGLTDHLLAEVAGEPEAAGDDGGNHSSSSPLESPVRESETSCEAAAKMFRHCAASSTL